MTDQPDDLSTDQPDEGDDPLVAELKKTRRVVARSEADTAQAFISRWRAVIFAVLVGLVIDTAATGFAFAAFVREADNRRHNEQVICERLNEDGAKHVELWTNVIAQNPAPAPPPDAPPAEHAAFAEQQKATAQFVADLRAQFGPEEC